MVEPSEKIAKFLIFFIIMVVIIKSANNAGLFEPKSHKGSGYSVKVPDGWVKVRKMKKEYFPRGVEMVMFVPEGTDVEKEQPAVFITIYTKKLTTPIWIEDEFPDIISSLTQAGMEVKDKGEINLDDKISNWVVYYDKVTPALVLEFYVVTDNSIFYKIQYSAPPEEFNVNRNSFEQLKNSFKYRFSIY